MKDQADNLRKIMSSKNYSMKKSIINNKAKVLAITSGKGGVGKTNFAINLALCMRRLGYKILILDVDFGLANVEILTRTNIRYTIADCLITGKAIEEIIGEGPEGIKIISGGLGSHELSIMNEKNISKFINELKKVELNTDFIIIDTGAGVSNAVLDFVMAADETILITTPDPTSIMDAYTMIKALTINGYKGKLNIITNIVNNRREAYDTFNKLNRASNSFLKYELNFLGYLEKTDIVSKAVKNQLPFVLSNPSSAISKKLNVIALKFVDSNKYKTNIQTTSFAAKLKNLFFKKR